jgi:hypothetical protein
VLTQRELALATLARQLLLERAPVGAVEAVELLCGMQAQEPRPPFVGLWSRLDGFDPDELRAALRSGAVVRGPIFRGTLHLMSEHDWQLLRPAAQPALSQAARVLRERIGTIDVARVTTEARRLLAEAPRTAGELRALLHAAFPDEDERALGYVARMNVPVVAVVSEDRWCFPRDPLLRLAETTNGAAGAEQLVRRYLAAFGPASVADAQEWSGVPGLRATFAAQRGELSCFADERGRELFDLPEAPRPPADTPAPVRFLPDFDNLVLAHADRSRLIADEHRARVTTRNLRVNATVLHDGRVRATWSLQRRARSATLEVTPFERLPATALKTIEREGEALAAAIESDAGSVAVRIAGP